MGNKGAAMTVQSCERMRGSTWQGSGTVTGGNRFKVSYQVETDDLDDGPLQIATQAENSTPDQIPKKFAPYVVGNDYDYTVVHKQRSTSKIKEISGGALWRVDCTWERPGTQEDDDLKPPPQRPTKYRIEWAQFTWPAKYDQAGKPILNKAGQPYPEGIDIDDARPVFVAEKNLGSLTEVLSLATAYRNAVNSTAFYGAKPRHAKVESITAGAQEEEEGIKFFPTIFRIQIADTPWDFVKKEEGFGYYNKIVNGEPERLVTAKDDTASGFAEPVALNSNGTKSPIDLLPIFTDWRVYPERDFSGLGI